MKRLSLFTSFLLFLALCASVAYWLFQWMAPATRPLVLPAPAEPAPPAMSAAANLFGGTVELVLSIPIQLKGIIHAANPSESVAIIALEGKPARALRVNAEVMGGLVIKQINSNSVVLVDQTGNREIPLPAFSSQNTTPAPPKTEIANQPTPQQ